MAKFICLFNHKGGVSKTTTTYNLGWALSKLGNRVLMVDLDPQCNLTGLVLSSQALNDDFMTSFYQNKQFLTFEPIIEKLYQVQIVLNWQMIGKFTLWIMKTFVY